LAASHSTHSDRLKHTQKYRVAQKSKNRHEIVLKTTSAATFIVNFEHKMRTEMF